MAPRLLVLCDIGASIGIGHLMRCLALSEEFADRGWEVVYAADVATVPFARGQVEARGFAHVPAPTGPAQVLDTVEQLAPRAVLVDSYRLPVALYGDLRKRWTTLAMVDGDPRGRVADVVVDQNIGAERDDWDYGDSAVVLAGLGYAAMRSDLLEHRPADPARTEHDPLRVFAFFGGTDAFGAGPRVAAELVATGAPFHLTVVAPGGWPDDVAAAGGVDQRIEVIAPTTTLAEHVRAADLVVSAAGTSSWELLCLGAACGLVCVTDNQELSYGRAVEAGLVAGVGHLGRLDRTAPGVLSRLLADAGERSRLRAAGHAAVDGGGRSRVVDAVEHQVRTGTTGPVA